MYQSFYNQKVDDDIFSRNYLYYQPNNRIYPFAIAYISSNYRRKIDSRYFVGAGLTYQLINQPLHIVKLSANAVYEYTKFNGSAFNYSKYDGDNNINVWRGTLYLAGWDYLFQRHVRLYYDAFWQPAFNNSNNYRSQADVGLDFPVWKGLSFTALYTFTHENVVVDKIVQDDKILTFGVAYNVKIKRR